VNLARVSIIATLLVSGFSQADTLDTARKLEVSRYKNWTYGSNAAKREVDCVQFILAVVEEELRATLKDEIRKAILIDHGWSPIETQVYAAKGTDPRLGGVRYALCQLSKYGKEVAAAEAQQGDVVQYWMKKSDGTWFGHAGVISSIKDGRAKLYGAHSSQNRIVDSPFSLDLNGPDRRVYLVRLVPPR
jgi:hypothetical protein